MQYPTSMATFGLTSTGNPQAILMCLSSVLNQTLKPKKILIRMEGEYPGFGNFYMEQLAALARIMGIEFSVHCDSSRGIRYARDWLIANCTTEDLWMGDDDVIYAPDCLLELYAGMNDAYNHFLHREGETFKVGYINGNKPDVNNRRGYKDFQLIVKQGSEVQNHDGYNYFFTRPGKTVLCGTCDTGNLLINVGVVRSAGVQFQQFDKEFNSSGDDTLFALDCHAHGLLGFFRTSADSYHLEKEGVRFDEFTARKNMILRACELKGYDKTKLGSMLPWLK